MAAFSVLLTKKQKKLLVRKALQKKISKAELMRGIIDKVYNWKIISKAKERKKSNRYKYDKYKYDKYKYDGGKWGYRDYRNWRLLKKKRCEICRSLKNLVLHHKDKNTRNFSPKNCLTVCQKCHINKFHRKKATKYMLLYGKTLAQMAKEKNTTIGRILYQLKKKEKTSKYIRLYGKTLSQMAKERKISIKKVLDQLKKKGNLK